MDPKFQAVALSLHLPKDGLIQLQSEKSSLSSFFILGSFSTKSLSHVKYRNTLLPIGSLIQIIDGRLRSSKPRLGQFRSEKEAVRQCFLFSNHLIVATRTSGGKLHLVPGVGKIPLQEATLIEDPNEANSQDDDGESSICSTSSQSSGMSESSAATSSGSGHGKSLGPIPVEQINLDFKIIVEQKNSVSASIHLVAPTMQEKQAWISDISQCLDNVHFNNLFRASISDTSSVTMPHYIKNDPKLFKDDVDIRFSRTLNSCKVPHIRYATPEKLLERLTDLRFLSIDFLNTFLLTYRVFTDGVSVLEALKKVYYSPDIPDQDESRDSSVDRSPEYVCSPPPDSDLEGQPHKRSSAFSAFSEPLELEPTPSVPPPSPVNQKHQQIRFQDEVPNNEESLSNETPAETDEIPKGSSPEPLEAGERICSRCGFVAASKNASDSPSGIDLIGESSEHLWPAQSEVSRGSGNDHSSEHWRWSHKKFEEDQKSREPGTRDDSGFSKLFRTTFSIDEEFGQCECAEDEMKISSDEHVSTLKDETTTFQEENSSEECKTEATFQEETELEVKEQTFQEDPLPVRAEENEKKDTVIHEETKATEEINIDEAENEERTKESKREHIFQEEQEVISAQETEEGEGNNGNAVRESLEMESESAVLLRRWVEVIPENQESSQEVIKINYDNVVSGICKETDLEATEIPKEQKSKGERGTAGSDEEQWQQPPPRKNSGQRPSTTHLSVGSRGRSKRMSTESEFGYAIMGALSTPRSSVQTATPRSSFQVPDATQHSSRVGVVITSSRQSQRRSSSASAAAAFAVATAGSSNPRDLPKTPPSSRFSVVSDGRRPSFKDRPARQESIISTAATMRVLNVLRHWVSKHWQDFESDYNLCRLTTEFLEDLVCCPTLLPAEHKAASQLLRLITKEDQGINRIDINAVLASPLTPSKENIETLSAMDIAEQMTYLDHHIFVSIRSEEFLKTAWTKDDKQDRAPHILVITRRFNEMSRLVVSEVARRNTLATRISVIEKWVAVADICRVLHNFNGVLQVCAAFQNSSLFRLKKTWEKVSKTTRQTLDKLQSLVSADGRFRNLRDALHRCDPPCIPYLGMYLTDLSFIEEGTPNFTEEGLLNFSKMRMVAHVIREIRHFQQTPYKIEHIPRVCSYLLDRSLLLADDELYKLSLEIEPRRMTLTQTTIPSIPVVSTPTSSTSS